MPAEEPNSFISKYEYDCCKELDAYLNTQNVTLVGCDTTSDFSSVRIQGSSINQDIIDKITAYDGILDYVTFERVTTIQNNLNLRSLKTSELYFDNKHLPYTGEKQEIYIPRNVLKTAKNVNKISINGFNISQRNINEISNLTKLIDLVIDSCTVDYSMDYTKLKNLKNLITLILSTVFIKDESVKYLNEIPESVCQLKKLNYLSLYRNDITSLPKCIKNLKNLETLNLNLNKLQSLPKVIGNLIKLKTIYLDENQLESIPVEFGKLTELEELTLVGNKISILPNEFGNLTSLKKLDLSYNMIGSIPTAIGKLSILKNLI